MTQFNFPNQPPKPRAARAFETAASSKERHSDANHIGQRHKRSLYCTTNCTKRVAMFHWNWTNIIAPNLVNETNKTFKNNLKTIKNHSLLKPRLFIKDSPATDEFLIESHDNITIWCAGSYQVLMFVETIRRRARTR